MTIKRYSPFFIRVSLQQINNEKVALGIGSGVLSFSSVLVPLLLSENGSSPNVKNLIDRDFPSSTYISTASASGVVSRILAGFDMPKYSVFQTIQLEFTTRNPNAIQTHLTPKSSVGSRLGGAIERQTQIQALAFLIFEFCWHLQGCEKTWKNSPTNRSVFVRTACWSSSHWTYTVPGFESRFRYSS